MRFSSRFVGACVCTALSMMTAAAMAEDYKIQLVRPAKVGDQFTTSVTAKVTDTVQTMLNGEQDKKTTESFTAELQGTSKVLEIDAKAAFPTKIRYEVDKLTRNDVEYYPAGTVIIAKRSGIDIEFEIDGERPDEKHAAVLEALLDPSSPNSITARDESIGTTARQKVGDSWPINADKCAAYYAEGGMPITAKELKGESTLASIKTVDGVDAMVIKSKITIDGMTKEVRGGGTYSDGKFTAEVTDVLPVDASRPTISIVVKSTNTITYNPPIGSKKSIMTNKTERRERRDPATP